MTHHPVARWLLATALMFCLSIGWALPTPSDIEAAIHAGQTTQAESMLREVLKEKPQSAKAHYELGQVLARQGRYDAALRELKVAESIDPTLKFAHSPEQFNRIVMEVEQLRGKPAISTGAALTPTPSPVPSKPALELSTVWWGIGLLFVIGLVLFLRRPRPAPVQVYTPATDSARGFGTAYNPAGYGPAAYPPPTSGGSAMTGAVVGGLAGVAAGYALAKAMEGEHHTDGSAQAGTLPRDNGGYVPFEPAASSELDAFDSGSGGDSWDAGDASGGGDDQW